MDEAHVTHVTPSGNSEYTLPLAGWKTNWWWLPPDKSLVLGEDGRAFGANGSTVVAFDPNTRNVNWSYQPQGGNITSMAVAAGLPDSVQRALPRRYAGLFGVFLKHRGSLTRVSFWGVHDGQSWLNNWPVKGRASYPPLFGRQGQPKPAFDAVIQVAVSAQR